MSTNKVFSAVAVSACLGTLVLFFAVDYLATRDANFGFLGSVYRYTAWQKNNVAGFFAWRKLMANSRDIKSTQEKELLRLLRMNSNTEYSKKWTLDQVDNRKDFVKGHPLVKYSHFEEYFDRMIESGEEDIICSQSPLHYALTSGTTGKPSRIPILPSYIQLSAEIRAVQAYKVGPLIPANKNLSRVSPKILFFVAMVPEYRTGVPPWKSFSNNLLKKKLFQKPERVLR